MGLYGIVNKIRRLFGVRRARRHADADFSMVDGLATHYGPQCAEAQFCQGRIDCNNGFYEEAEACFIAAIRIEPHYALAHFELAKMYHKADQLDDPEKALYHYRHYYRMAYPNGEYLRIAQQCIWELGGTPDAMFAPRERLQTSS
jgi:tetratricopeptide (TPR) repeat protein